MATPSFVPTTRVQPKTSLDLSLQAYANTLEERDAAAARRANVIGRDLGIPGPMVEADINGFDNERTAAQTQSILGADPKLTRFLVDPHNAASVKDDLPSLSSISTTLNRANDPMNAQGGFTNYLRAVNGRRPNLLSAITLQDTKAPKDYSFAAASRFTPPVTWARPTARVPTLGDWLSGISSGTFAAIEQAGQGAATYLADTIGKGEALKSSGVYQSLSAQIAADQARSQEVYEAEPTFLAQQAYSASQSIALMGAAILTKKPVASMGLQSGLQEYQQVRDRGGTAKEALAAGAVTGTAESAFEKYFGLGWMLGNFGKKATGKFLGGLLLREVPSEVATTAVQDAADALVTGGEGWDSYVRRHSALNEDNPLIQTAASTALLVGAMGGGHYIASRVSPELRAMDDIERSAAGTEFVDTLMKAAEQSKVRKEDPTTLQTFVEQHTADSPVRNLYVPVEAAVAYMQSEKYGGELNRYQDQIEQAQATQGDVVIPIGDAVAHLSGTPAWDALKEEVRIEPGGLSRKEATTQHSAIIDQLEKRGAEIAKEVQDKEGQLDGASEVYVEVKNRLRIAGVDDKQADAAAQIYAARYEARAARRGGTPMEQFKASKISFPGEKAGRPAGRELGQKVAGYHGSHSLFDELDSPESPWAGFFSSDEAVAHRFAEGISASFADGRRGGIHSAEIEFKNPLVIDAKGDFAANFQFGPRREEFLRGFQGKHDGVILKNTKDEGDVFIPRDKAQIKITGRILRQGPRGSTTFADSGEKLIQLFGTADRSTLLHETGHIWLEELKADALADDATDADKADWETVKAWFKTNGVSVRKDGFIPTEAHEYWARGVERYFMEGKSPSAKLASVFRTFKAWLLRIYGVVQNLNTPITPEVREVMDRLIATQDAIDEARRMNATEPLFKTAEEAQMTDAEFADYQERIANARDEAYDALLYKTMEAIRRQRTQEMRDIRAGIRDEVAQEINKQPQFRLLHLLRTGKWLGEPDRPARNVKLNSGWLIDNYGEDIFEKLPRGIQIWAGNGETGDVIAEMVGLGSGDEVVKTLAGIRAASDELRRIGETRSMRDKLIAEETDRIMAERYGDALTDGTLEEEAVAALNSARQGEIIAAEARQLAKRKHVLGTPTPYQFAREWARRTVAAGNVRDVATRAALQRYIRGVNKAARAAETAILAGDIDEAYRQKQAQLLNHALLAEAKAAADRVDKIVARMRKYAGRAAMKSVAPEYFEKVHMLLENYDFRPRSQRSIDEQEKFQEWLEHQRVQGFEVHIPPRLDNNGTPFSRVSVQELDSLNDLVESLIAVGRTKQKIKVAQEERNFAEYRDEVIARIRQLPDRKLPTKPINEEQRKIAAMAAELLKVETIAEELDRGPTGPLHDVLVLGATNAENLRHDLRHRVMLPLAEAYKSLGRKYWRRLNEKVTIPELTWNTLNEGDPRLGSPVTITRSELLAIFMNMGNISNLEKLSKGERWPVETLKAVMDRELTKEDYDFAQKMWDQVELLWPEIVNVERELSGIVPEKVVNNPIQTRFGEYRGGYWPMVYDPARWQLAEDLEGKQLDDMFGMKSGVATQKGHTISRTGAYGPVNLSIERVLFSHLEQVVTRIAYAPYARDVLRTIRDKSIRGWIDTKLGPEYRKQIEPWLARQIHQGHPHPKGARWWDSLFRQFRVNMTIAAMGFRLSTGAAQVLGLTASAQRIGAKWVGVGMTRLAAHPIEAARFAYAKSPELLHRTEAVNREVAEVANRMRQRHKIWNEAQHWAMWHIGMIDRYMVALPTWLGAYEKGRSENMTDDEAVAYADKSVRMSQGTGREKDMAAVQSPNSEAMRFFTMFYTPFNVMFNAQWQGARGIKARDPRPLIAVTWWWLVMSTLGDALMSGDWPEWANTDIKDLKSVENWFARNVFFGLWAGIPVARDFANWGERKLIGQYTSEPGMTPITRVGDAVNQAWNTGKRKVVKGEDPKRPIKEAGDLTAILLGVPTSQIGATGQFAWDVHKGTQDPKSVSDWYFGITKGKVPKEKDNAQ